MCPLGVMVRCMSLGPVVRASGRALSTAAGRQRQKAQVADRAVTDTDSVPRRNFADVQWERKEQARHSVLVSCPPKINEKTFLKHFSQHGEIANHFFFDSYGTHAVVEFVNRESIDSLLSHTKLPENEDSFIVPYKSRLFKVHTKYLDQQFVNCVPQTSLSSSQLLQKLSDATTIEDQAHIILEEQKLTDESIRLRYLVSSLVCDIAIGYFPDATIDLYGSSVNTFGKMGCDVDLFLNLDSIKDGAEKATGSFVTEFWMKRVYSSRVSQQKVLSVIGDCIENLVPGCSQVQKILKARCPLIRFFHQAAGLNCDLTADNRIALRSSELLYIYGNIDSRVQPLVFALRYWARVHGITSSVSGHWITNFSLTTMILFFLQKRNPPIIPTLDQLKNLADKNEKCIIESHDCTFVSDLSKIEPSANTESIEKLLNEFLEYYSNFDFQNNGLDIRKGVVKSKPEPSPLYIQNPFEQSLNISKNVNRSQMEKFVVLLQESAWTLQKQAAEPRKEGWGLIAILQAGGSLAAPKPKHTAVSQRLGNLLESLKNDQINRKTT